MKSAIDVLLHESKALETLAHTLDAAFTNAVEVIQKTKGRLIVSGVGKSGLVGRKMAATFASTGQPAFFVHAAEAGHGDLGMITQDDTLLLISYSGQARELQTVLSYAHRFSIPIIAITSQKSSVLAAHSTIALLLPDVGEACPMGLAPTTSTTLTMALGDALAVALLTLKGFNKTDFSAFHPGGNLGFKLQSIQDFMHTKGNIPLAQKTLPLIQCLHIMSEKKLGCVAIVDDQHHLLGVMTDGDLRRFIEGILEAKATQNIQLLTAQDIMTPNPVTIREDSLLGDALALFEKKSITNLFVVDDHNKILGVLHIHDCLRGKAI